MKTFITIICFCLLSVKGLAKCTCNQEEMRVREQMLEVLTGGWVVQSIYVATKLDIASHLQDGGKGVEELAKLTSSDRTALYRLLRMLSNVGIFREEEGGYFTNTPLSTLLIENHPQSLRNTALYYGGGTRQSWDMLYEAVRKGESPFQLKFNMHLYEYLQKNPEESEIVYASLEEKARSGIAATMEVYDFSPYKKIVDVGGAHGLFIRELLLRYPDMEGIVYDLPFSVVSAKAHAEEFGDRYSIVEGNFFQSVPEGGDAYIIKSTLDSWDDQASLKILKNCHKAIPPEGRLILVEAIISGMNQKRYAHLLDMQIFALTGCGERTEKEIRELLKKAGFKVEKVIPTGTEYSVIEASKT